MHRNVLLEAQFFSLVLLDLIGGAHLVHSDDFWADFCAVQVEAQLQPGRLQLVFDLEKPQAFKGGVSTDDADRASKNGTKRALNEPGPNKKRREKVPPCLLSASRSTRPRPLPFLALGS